MAIKSPNTLSNTALEALASEMGISWSDRKQVLKAVFAAMKQAKEPQVEMVEMVETGLHSCEKCKVMTPQTSPVCSQCQAAVVAPTATQAAPVKSKRVYKKRVKGPAVKLSADECQMVWTNIQAGSSAKSEAQALGIHIHTLITNMYIHSVPYKV